MEILLLYLFCLSLNCILTIFLYREVKKEEQDKMKIKIMSWSLIAINILLLIFTLYYIYTKKK
jgi:hypothetical protein